MKRPTIFQKQYIDLLNACIEARKQLRVKVDYRDLSPETTPALAAIRMLTEAIFNAGKYPDLNNPFNSDEEVNDLIAMVEEIKKGKKQS